MLSRCLLDLSVGVGAFVMGLSQTFSFFSLKQGNHRLETVHVLEKEKRREMRISSKAKIPSNARLAV